MELHRTFATGECAHHENQAFDLDQAGVMQQAMLSYSIVSIKSADQEIIGVFVVFHETHAQPELKEFIATAADNKLLLKLSDTLLEAKSTDDMQLQAAAVMREHLGINDSFFYEYVSPSPDSGGDAAQPDLECHYCFDELPSPNLNLLRSGRPLAVSDVNNPSCPNLGVYKVLNLQSFLLIPVIRHRCLVAVFNLSHHSPRYWSDREIALAEQAAERTWNFIAKSRDAVAAGSRGAAPCSASCLWHGDTEQLVAVLGHELKNPLAAMQYALEILQRAPDQSEHVIRTRGIFARQTAQMGYLVNGLLDFTGITRDKVQLQREIIDAREIVRNVLEDQHYRLDSGSLQLQVNVPDEPVWLWADRARVTQILADLFGNAVKYTEVGCICVSLHTEASSAVLSVRDTGVGIRPEAVANLFQPFHQEKMAGYDVGGLGLGLTIAKGLVDLHNGKIIARSKGLGHGAEFEVRLPLGPSA